MGNVSISDSARMVAKSHVGIDVFAPTGILLFLEKGNANIFASFVWCNKITK